MSSKPFLFQFSQSPDELDAGSMVLVPGLAELLELAREIWVETNAAGTPAGTKPADTGQCAALLGEYPVVMQF